MELRYNLYYQFRNTLKKSFKIKIMRFPFCIHSSKLEFHFHFHFLAQKQNLSDDMGKTNYVYFQKNILKSLKYDTFL